MISSGGLSSSMRISLGMVYFSLAYWLTFGKYEKEVNPKHERLGLLVLELL